jgi:hypothetical protein
MSSYHQEQAQMDAQYTAQYREWVANMTPEERADAERLGLLKPDTSRRSFAGDDSEKLEKQVASSPQEATDESGPAEASGLDGLRLTIGVLIGSSNLRLSVVALCYASGMSACAQWRNQSDAARSIGVTRQALNKAIRQWQKLLDLPTNQYTATSERRQKLSVVQTQKHWRKRSFTTQKQA